MTSRLNRKKEMKIQLRDSILCHYPDADTSILNKLSELVEKYALK